MLPGRGMLTIAFVDYEDTDLGAYHELGVIFLVRGPHGRGVYVHHLPVDQEFTLAAGREIWGYPKSLARISIEQRGREATCTLEDALEITMRDGAVPMPQPALPTYTHMDGVLRSTSWRMEGSARARPGGARVSLGSNPIADELRALGLPKRALMCSTVARYRATFDPPRVLARV